jgi:hypothetical protein
MTGLVAALVLLAAAPPAPELLVESEPPGASVVANGRTLGVTPWQGPRAVGALELELRLDGHLTDRRTVSLPASGEGPFVVRVALEREPQPPAPLPPEPDPTAGGEPAPAGEPAAPAPPPEPTTVWRVAGFASEGLAIIDGSALRSAARLHLAGQLDWRWLRVFLGAAFAVEEPGTVVLHHGYGVELFGPLYARVGLDLMVSPAVDVGVPIGLGADITLFGPLTLHAGVDATVWPSVRAQGVALTLEARLGLGAAF